MLPNTSHVVVDKVKTVLLFTSNKYALSPSELKLKPSIESVQNGYLVCKFA